MKTMSPWVSIPGLVFILWGASVSARRDAWLALIVGFFMQGLLVPMHYESRYYLFLMPFVVAAVFIGAREVLQKIAESSMRVGWSVGATVVVLAVIVSGGQRVWAEVDREAVHARNMDEVCAKLVELAGDRTILVGVPPGHYTYSSYRHCPRPTREGLSPVVLVQTDPEGSGLDYWLGGGGALPVPGARSVDERIGLYEWPRYEPDPLEDLAMHSAFNGGLVHDLPSRRACQDVRIDAPAGGVRLVAELGMTHGIPVRLSVGRGSGARFLYFAATATAVVTPRFEGTESEPLEVALCAMERDVKGQVQILRAQLIGSLEGVAP